MNATEIIVMLDSGQLDDKYLKIANHHARHIKKLTIDKKSTEIAELSFNFEMKRQEILKKDREAAAEKIAVTMAQKKLDALNKAKKNAPKSTG